MRYVTCPHVLVGPLERRGYAEAVMLTGTLAGPGNGVGLLAEESDAQEALLSNRAARQYSVCQTLFGGGRLRHDRPDHDQRKPLPAPEAGSPPFP
ncbi:MAG: hypothetical protein M3021_03315 [Actinomycetota bacterium]|nr:hypothetical protein [Actinomycetota bacterium]